MTKNKQPTQASTLVEDYVKANSPELQQEQPCWEDIGKLNQKLNESIHYISLILPFLENEVLIETVKRQGNFEELIKRVNGINRDLKVIGDTRKQVFELMPKDAKGPIELEQMEVYLSIVQALADCITDVMEVVAPAQRECMEYLSAAERELKEIESLAKEQESDVVDVEVKSDSTVDAQEDKTIH